MTPDDPLFKQLIATFSAELESLLIVIVDNLQKIKQGLTADSLTKSIEEISRAGRNIKALAFAVGVDTLGLLAESLEKSFLPETKVSESLMNLATLAVDAMRETMQDFIANKPSSASVKDLLHQFEQQLHQPQKVESVPAPKAEPFSSLEERDFFKQIIETFKLELQENLISITNNLLKLEKGGLTETDSLSVFEEIFRAAHNIKGSARGVGAMDVGDIAHHVETLFTMIQNNTLKISPALINLCLQSMDCMNEAMQCYSEELPLSFDLKEHLRQLEEYTQSSQQQEPSPEKSEQITKKNAKPKASEFESIRIELKNLDYISADMEELQATKIAIEEHCLNLGKLNFKLDYFFQSWKKNVLNIKTLMGVNEEWLESLFSIHESELSEFVKETHAMHRALRRPVNELSNLLNELQDQIRMVRLIPVEVQLRSIPRIVRDLATELNKQVNLEIKVSDVKIDKMIFDGIKDPLVHILRNSIDHGIETPEIRQKAGKAIVGTILIEVSQEGHQIVFKISDDGAGINVNALVQIALKRNVISQEDLELMKPEDILDLIFRPGFTTREFATTISGRGVGLDVVRANLAHLHGQVNLETQLGKGTQFFLRVPITLATERGLFVVCDKQVFVIGTPVVESVFLFNRQDIIDVEGVPAVLVKDEPVVLSSLNKLLNFNANTQDAQEQLFVVIIKKDQDRVALMVDDILGEREIILKPLQEPLAHLPYVTGATLTGSNQINFVLNASEIIKKALL